MGVFEVSLVGIFIILLIFWQGECPERPIFLVALKLIWIGLANAKLVTILAAPTRQWPEPRFALMIDDIVFITAWIFRCAILIDHAAQAKTGTEVKQHGLEGTDIAVGSDHRMADRIAWPVGCRDRPVEQRDCVIALEISRVGQDEIGIGDHLAVIGIGINDLWDFVFAILILVGEVFQCRRNVH